MIKNIFLRFWDSPTFTTWGSFFTKSLSLLIVLPLILAKLTTSEINVWFLFNIMISLQVVVNMGFTPTFTRVLGYAINGSEINDLVQPSEKVTGEPNLESIEEIIATMRVVFLLLSILWLILLSCFGTLSLIKPINLISSNTNAWLAWLTIIITSTFSFYGSLYSSYLQGINNIPLLRRWESFSNLISILFSCIVLIFSPTLLNLVLANQFGLIILFFILIKVSYKSPFGLLFKKKHFLYYNRDVIRSIWPSTWRSGLGIITSFGLTQSTGIFYAQIGNSGAVASYLLGLRLIRMINQFSAAPFYSKIPALNGLYVKNDIKKLVNFAQRGMFIAYLSYVFPFFILGIFGEFLTRLFNSNADFPSVILWILLGFAFFLERLGAMHIQLYSVTNKIIWHKANGITGIINALFIIIFYKYFEVYTFPAAMIVSYISFYCWYSINISIKKFEINFYIHTKKTLLVPLILFLVYCFLVNLI